ncbi:MAG: hypothetical protein COA79_23200 [Planctomycetota bacterium]|nr:MAG: hypothetical protein COA79_23200 [Planctomycetota bacterium]
MGLIAKENGSTDFKKVSAGVHESNCISIWDIGTQENKKFEKFNRKIMIQWEVDELVEVDGVEKPMTILKEYTLSLNDKSNLRADLVSWRGRDFTEAELDGFDLKDILGKPCQLNVVHRENGGKTYANILAIMPKGKSQKADSINTLSFYSIDDSGFDYPEGLPAWIVRKIEQSEEFRNQNSFEKPVNNDISEEDIPF